MVKGKQQVKWKTISKEQLYAKLWLTPLLTGELSPLELAKLKEFLNVIQTYIERVAFEKEIEVEGRTISEMLTSLMFQAILLNFETEILNQVDEWFKVTKYQDFLLKGIIQDNWINGYIEQRFGYYIESNISAKIIGFDEDLAREYIDKILTLQNNKEKVLNLVFETEGQIEGGIYRCTFNNVECFYDDNLRVLIRRLDNGQEGVVASLSDRLNGQCTKLVRKLFGVNFSPKRPLPVEKSLEVVENANPQMVAFAASEYYLALKLRRVGQDRPLKLSKYLSQQKKKEIEERVRAEFGDLDQQVISAWSNTQQSEARIDLFKNTEQISLQNRKQEDERLRDPDSVIYAELSRVRNEQAKFDEIIKNEDLYLGKTVFTVTEIRRLIRYYATNKDKFYIDLIRIRNGQLQSKLSVIPKSLIELLPYTTPERHVMHTFGGEGDVGLFLDLQRIWQEHTMDMYHFVPSEELDPIMEMEWSQQDQE